MDSMPKRQKHIDEAQIGEETPTLGHEDHFGEQQEDRLSNLPDAILCHILRKLPTKYAVVTAVLSTRWKHLFSEIPNLLLYIDDDDLLLHPNQEGNSDPVSRGTSFINFMHHLLTVTLRDVPRIRSLCLDCHHDYGGAHIDAWISAVLRLNVERITLSWKPKNSGVSLPNSLFCSTTLVHLALSLSQQQGVLTIPSSVCLPNLKSIFFDCLKFTDSDSLERVVAGCPVLETLSIEGCEFEDIEVLCISSPSLKLLILRNCYHESEYELELDTPTLELLTYNDYVAEGYSIKILNSLLKAYIDIGPSPKQLDEDTSFYDENVADFVAACSDTEALYLSALSMEAIYYSFRPMPMFNKLTELKLGALNSSGWHLLPHLIASSPNLQVLVFTEGFLEHKGCYTIFQESLLEYVPSCLSLPLQKVKVEGFNGKKDEIRLIKYFLLTARVLQTMKIRWARLYSEKQVCIWQEILNLPRTSKNCRIELAKLR